MDRNELLRELLRTLFGTCMVKTELKWKSMRIVNGSGYWDKRKKLTVQTNIAHYRELFQHALCDPDIGFYDENDQKKKGYSRIEFVKKAVLYLDGKKGGKIKDLNIDNDDEWFRLGECAFGFIASCILPLVFVDGGKWADDISGELERAMNCLGWGFVADIYDSEIENNECNFFYYVGKFPLETNTYASCLRAIPPAPAFFDICPYINIWRVTCVTIEDRNHGSDKYWRPTKYLPLSKKKLVEPDIPESFRYYTRVDESKMIEKYGTDWKSKAKRQLDQVLDYKLYMKAWHDISGNYGHEFSRYYSEMIGVIEAILDRILSVDLELLLNEKGKNQSEYEEVLYQLSLDVEIIRDYQLFEDWTSNVSCVRRIYEDAILEFTKTLENSMVEMSRAFQRFLAPYTLNQHIQKIKKYMNCTALTNLLQITNKIIEETGCFYVYISDDEEYRSRYIWDNPFEWLKVVLEDYYALLTNSVSEEDSHLQWEINACLL